MYEKLFLVCAATAVTLILGCKNSALDSPKNEKPEIYTSSISVSTSIDGKTVALSGLSGIPYTATESSVNPAGKLVLTAKCDDSSLLGEEISANIIEPAENAPLTLTKAAGKNQFDVQFSTVASPVRVKLTFSTKKGNAKSTLVFNVLPEPVMESISCTPNTLTYGKDAEFQLKPKITCTPDKYDDIPAEYFIRPANKMFTYASSNTSVVSVTPTGLRTHAVGEADITVSLGDKTCAVKIKVDNSVSKITSIQSDGGKLYYGHDVTLTAVLKPADAVTTLKWEANDADVSITKDASDEKKAVVKVLNKNAGEKDVIITVMPTAKPELKHEVKLTLYTVVPKSGADKMYKKETVQFTISAESTYGADVPADTSVRWNIWSNSANVSIDSDGRLDCTRFSRDNGTPITIRAESKLNPSVEAKKEITVYNNVASITSVSTSTNECTIGDDSDAPILTLTLAHDYFAYKHFAVSEKIYFSGEPTTDYFEKAVYTLNSNSSFPNRIILKPTKHTSGEAKTFYVYPIDPKTEKAVTASFSETFTLTIWQEATGIELQKGNFDIETVAGGYKTVAHISYGTTGHTFYARIIPEYAQQNMLKYTIKRTLGNYTCIQHDKKADTQDRPGWTKYQFDTNSQNTLGGHDKAKFNFTVEGDSSISTFLEIDSN